MGSPKYPGRRRLNGRQLTAVVGVAGALALAGCGGSSGGSSGGSGGGATQSASGSATSGKIVWSPVDVGYIDWAAQFRALEGIGYSNAVNLETHWRGAGTPEASSVRSWEGMKKALEQDGAM